MIHPSIPRFEARRGPAVAALYAATVVVYAGMYITQPILPVLSAEFGVAPATAGMSVSAVVLAIALASGGSGPLSDVLGRKRVMVWSCTLLALPLLLCALAPSFEWLLAARALQGVCIPGLTAVAVVYLSDHFPASDLGALVGGWIAATVTGGLAGRVLSGLITDLSGWRAAFASFAALTMFCALGMATLLPRDPARPPSGWISAFRGMTAHLLNPRLAGAYVIGGALFFGFIGVFTYLPYYLTTAPFHLSPTMVSMAYLSYLAGVVVSPLAGRLSTRLTRPTLIGAGLVVAMIGLAGTLLPVTGSIGLSLVVLCAGMFTAQAVAPAHVAATAQEAKGGASALYLMSYYIGGALGAVVPGVAWQSLGWAGVIATCVAAFGIALLANLTLCCGKSDRVGG